MIYYQLYIHQMKILHVHKPHFVFNVLNILKNFVNTDIYWERLSLPQNLSTPPTRKWENSIQCHFNSPPFGKYQFLSLQKNWKEKGFDNTNLYKVMKSWQEIAIFAKGHDKMPFYIVHPFIFCNQLRKEFLHQNFLQKKCMNIATEQK